MSGPRALGERLLRLALAWRAHPARVRRRLSRHGLRPSDALRRVDPAAVRLAAVQLPLRLVGSPEEYVDLVAPWAARAAEQGAQLVAFPEDAAAPLLGMLPGIERLLEAGSVEAAVSGLAPGARVADVFAFLAPAVRRVWSATFAGLARALRVYVHAGTAVLPDRDGRVYNVAALFGPDGRLLASARKAHLLPLEDRWGLAPGDDLATCDTLLGRVGLPVCMDATYWETFRILYLRGVDLAVLPTANPEEYDEWRVRRGLWARVQESPMYGVHSCLVGRLLDLRLTGRSGIYGPGPLSPGGDGVWARVDDPHGPGVAVAAVDLQALHRYRRERGPELGFNPVVYGQYFPHVYRRAGRRRGEGRT